MAEPVLDNDDIKKRATRRLFVAVALVGIAAGILTWLSNYKPSKPITTQPTPDTVVEPPVIAPEPAPIVAAPAEPPALEQMPPIEPVPEVAPAPAPTPAAPPPTLGAPPPPKVVSKPLPPPGPGPKAAPEAAKPLVKAEPPIAPAPPEAAPVHVPSGYVVQFGVFGNPQNALQLVERLKQAGIAAQTETRVQLPPFKTKVEAEAALAKLKAKGISAVVVAR